jgi:hypothetical protein
MSSPNPSDPTPREQAITEEVARQVGGIYLVIRCLIRTLAHQPNFDRQAFLQTLAKEEGELTERAELAKEMIREIVSEVEGIT